MTLEPNPSNAQGSLRTLTNLQRRYRELRHHARNQPQQAADPETDELLDWLGEELNLSLDDQEDDPEPHAEPNDEPLPSASALPPAELDETALHGLAGRTVRGLAPHTEAHPAAILLQFLAAFSNLVGPGPHCLVGCTRHGLNLFVVLVGESSKARKGTSWRAISSLFAECDPDWAARCITTARPTSATILHALRDQQPATDRRLFLLSEEFASVLQVLGRDTSQLSPLLRSAWDGGDLRAYDGHHPVQASAAHISIVGHVTQSELAHHLSRTDSHNGFANRCLWTSVRRAQSLPEGGALPPAQHSLITAELRRTLDWLRSQNEIVFSRTPAARDLWHGRYHELSQGREDAYGAATSRAEAQVLRLSAIYAALDCSPSVDTCHLQAALAVWNYCKASARVLFDTAPTDPTARRISQALDVTPGGLTKVQIRALFHRHVSKERIDLALEQLMSLGLIGSEKSPGRGRPATLWTKMKAEPSVEGGTYGA
jgi:hypothetical protein